MTKRFPLLVSYKNLFQHLPSTTPVVGSNRLFISNANAHVHTQGGSSIVGEAAQGALKGKENVEETAKERVENGLGSAEKTRELLTETIVTAEADTNVVDTVEYRCSEDLGGQLGDGHDLNA